MSFSTRARCHPTHTWCVGWFGRFFFFCPVRVIVDAVAPRFRSLIFPVSFVVLCRADNDFNALLGLVYHVRCTGVCPPRHARLTSSQHRRSNRNPTPRHALSHPLNTQHSSLITHRAYRPARGSSATGTISSSGSSASASSSSGSGSGGSSSGSSSSGSSSGSNSSGPSFDVGSA